MTHRLGSRFAVCLSAFVALAAFACSAAPPGSEIGDSPISGTPAAKKAENKTTTDTTPTTPTTPTPPAPSTADTGECGTKATADACGECCYNKNPAAYDAAGEIGYDCICAADACQTACAASICSATENENQPTAACEACLDQKGQACDDKATAACQANADCKVIDTCFATACDPIAAKEQPAGGKSLPKVLRSLRPAQR